MERSRVLENKNRISNINLTRKSTTETAGNLSFRFVFSGNETCTIGRRQLSVHTDSFIILNKGTQFTSQINSHYPVNVFSIEFDPEFLKDFNYHFFQGVDPEFFDEDNVAGRLRETIYPLNGESPHQFLIQLRLQRAQLLLTHTKYLVYEIVNMVGFKCTSSFIRLFRSRYKTTPLKYRNTAA